MKFNSAFIVAALVASLAKGAASDGDPSSAPLQVYPKNLARQHLGANLLSYNAATQKFVPAEAAAAWLDDDVATGWPAATGQHYYLVALPEPQLLLNFALSAKSSVGTVSLYAGDEAALPGAKSWTLLAQNAPVESFNEKLMSKAFSRFAKYVLIETNLKEAGSWYSVYLYGEKPAVAYHMERRAQPVDPRNLFGPYTNSQGAFSVSSLYAHGHVAYVNTTDSATGWQKAIDDNPETATSVAPSKNEAGMVIAFDGAQSIQRISVLTEGKAKGKLDFFLADHFTVGKHPASKMDEEKSQYIKASSTAAAIPANESGALSGMKPVATIQFDGNNPRGSADFTPTSGSQLIARWTPDDSAQTLAVSEVNSFGEVALNDHQLTSTDAVAEELGTDQSKDAKSFKEMRDPGIVPVGESFSPKTAFVVGPPRFPTNVPFSPK